MTLRTRLLMLVLAVLLPTAGLFVWIVAATYLRETEAAHQRLRETTHSLALLVDREFDKRAAIARTLGTSAAIAAGRRPRFSAVRAFVFVLLPSQERRHCLPRECGILSRARSRRNPWW